ncbi:hypothetical protein CKO15_08175 [Halorhodospira abdelmalekii]|uniref:ATP-binding protein n=1 Tax=Halorhodospira abdelmalekii TaxID=421629 RepID=UPI0019065A3B|nr:ATP-binding protein [Halorhodospira abdelmalekii]MBK1735262.1 hypothetical protein [Halorhodospira abdelmalekii]
MKKRQEIYAPGARAQALLPLLPQLREGLDAAVVRLKAAGERGGAIAGARAAVQRLSSGFRFLAIPELESLSAEIDAGLEQLGAIDAATDLTADCGAVADRVDRDQLRSELHSALSGCNEVLEGVVRGDDPLAAITAWIDRLRYARGAPRYDCLALLRQCLDPQAPRAWEAAIEVRARRARWPYQLAVLELLRGEEWAGQQQSLQAMQSLLERLEQSLGNSAAGSACWAALGLIEMLSAQAEPLSVADKRTLAGYDRELRRLTAPAAALTGTPPASLVEALLARCAELSESTAQEVWEGGGRWMLLSVAIARLPRGEWVLPEGPQSRQTQPADDQPRTADAVWVPRQPFGQSPVAQSAGWDRAREIARAPAEPGPLLALPPPTTPAITAKPKAVEEPLLLESEASSLGMLTPLYAEWCALLRREAERNHRLIEFEVVAAAGELQAAVVAPLREALDELLRNAVCHGIEAPDQRQRSGKSRRGKLRLQASLERTGALRIALSDDGAGIDVERLQQQLSDYVPDEAPLLTRGEILTLVSMPGVSAHHWSATAAEDARQRPRGDGMERVAAAVRQLRGLLDLETITAGGTTFTLRLPAANVLADTAGSSS